MKVVVTGATGFVGGYLVDTLVARGDTVTVIARPSSHLDNLRQLPISITTSELNDIARLAEIVSGHDVVIHVAGAIKALNRVELEAANVTATGSLARACSIAQSAPRRFVLVSSQAAHGPTRSPDSVDENDPPRPTSDYGRSKLGGERAVYPFRDRFETVIVRPSVVYGPGDRSLRSLFQLARLGFAPMLPHDPPISLIHIHDLTRCLVLASTIPAIADRAFFAATKPALRLSEILLAIGRAYGHIPISIPVPATVMRGAGIASDLFARITGVSRPFGLDKANEMLQRSWAISPDAAERDLGFIGTIPHRQGLAATADWYRSNGWVWP